MIKPPILSMQQREELKRGAINILERTPGSKFMFLEGCLSLIAELEIKDAIISQLGDGKLNDRCTAMAIQSTGIYRCTRQVSEKHNEHNYNWFRSLTKQEQEEYYPNEPR